MKIHPAKCSAAVEGFLVAFGKIVQSDNAVSAVEKNFRANTSDVAGCSGYEDSHLRSMILEDTRREGFAKLFDTFMFELQPDGSFSYERLGIPFPRSPQTFLEIHGRAIAENLARHLNIRLRM